MLFYVTDVGYSKYTLRFFSSFVVVILLIISYSLTAAI